MGYCQLYNIMPALTDKDLEIEYNIATVTEDFDKNYGIVFVHLSIISVVASFFMEHFF